MLKIRPYKPEDSKTILSWCGDERAFYQWTAGVLGDYPVTPKEFAFVEKLTPFTAFDERGIVGFFTLRQPGESAEELRFGFVIVKPEMRGKGYGKAMLCLGIKYAFDHGAIGCRSEFSKTIYPLIIVISRQASRTSFPRNPKRTIY